jgi:uncharacterized protein YggU (UPF0235/DUF167 family)
MNQGVFAFAVHVHPGARRPGVGGSHDGHLVVRVRARAVDGAANEEVLTSLATALGLARRQVEFIRVSTSRDKVVVVSDSDAVRVRHRELLDTRP